MEILHDLNGQIREMEDTMADNERLKEKTSSNWARNGSPVYMPRNPISYFKTNLMQTLNSSMNDSQTSSVYPVDVQKKIDEVFKRLQAPTNHININYSQSKNSPDDSAIKILNSKLAQANEAIANLRKLGKTGDPKNAEANAVREIGDKELSKLQSIVNPSFKQISHEVNNLNKADNSNLIQEGKNFNFKQILKDIKNNNEQLKKIKEEQNEILSFEKKDRDKFFVNLSIDSIQIQKLINDSILLKNNLIKNESTSNTIDSSNKDYTKKEISKRNKNVENDINNNKKELLNIKKSNADVIKAYLKERDLKSSKNIENEIKENLKNALKQIQSKESTLNANANISSLNNIKPEIDKIKNDQRFKQEDNLLDGAVNLEDEILDN